MTNEEIEEATIAVEYLVRRFGMDTLTDCFEQWELSAGKAISFYKLILLLDKLGLKAAQNLPVTDP